MNSTKLIKDRFPVTGDAGDLKRLDEAMCFEVSQVMALCKWQAEKKAIIAVPWPNVFLPWPVTFLECVDVWSAEGHQWRGRFGYLLKAAAADSTKFSIAAVMETPAGMRCDFQGFCNGGKLVAAQPDFDQTWWWQLTALLAAINSPKVFAKVEHGPHSGLAKRMAASRGAVGRYPLHAWHEIKIQGWVPRVESGVRRASLPTGETAQYRVRRYPRFQNGRWVEVKEHHRGNPQLGMRRGRYVVEMPRLGGAA